jgi:hypothetical protein
MPQFDDQSARRISRTVRQWERSQKNPRQHRKRYQRTIPEFVAFELTEVLDQWSIVPALARVRDWDPTANGGEGGFITDCSTGLEIKVLDAYQVGHNAGVGGCGRCEIRGKTTDGYLLGLIHDLCCPGDEQGDCIGSGS